MIRHTHRHRHPGVIVVSGAPTVLPSPGFVLGPQSALVIEDRHGTKIKNPHVPFVASLASGIHPGKKILIDGKAELDHSKRIIVNLGCGPAIEENIALHISMRHDEGVIVLNDRKFGQWGHEERHVHSIGWGMHIKLKIHAKGDHFKVKLNGKNLCKFHYRRAIADITHLQIEGGIHVHEVEVEKSKKHRHQKATVLTTVTQIPPNVAYQPPPVMYRAPPPPVPAAQHYPVMPVPTPYPPYGAAPYGAAQPPGAAPPYGAPPPTSGAPALNYSPGLGGAPAPLPPVSQEGMRKVEGQATAPPLGAAGYGMGPPAYAPSAGVPMPYFSNIHSMAVGRQIHISGTPALNAQELVIGLMNGPGKLAFYARIDFNQGVIIRNACPFGTWGPEERQLSSQFPFSRGQTFRIILFCDHDGYKMAVNGVHMVHFEHRVTFSTVNSMEIRGDATLASVEII